MACKECGTGTSPIYRQDFKCNKWSLKQSATNPKCHLRANIHDESGSIQASIFGSIAEKILGFTTTEIVENPEKGPGGVSITQKVEYEWVPSRCTYCECFGNSTEKCRKPKPVWLPKEPKEIILSENDSSHDNTEINQGNERPRDVNEVNKVSTKPQLQANPVSATTIKGPIDHHQRCSEEGETSGQPGKNSSNLTAPEAKNPAHSTKGPRSQQKLKPKGVWSFVDNFDLLPHSRILLLWNASKLNLHIIQRSDQLIHCSIVSGRFQFLATFVYALNSKGGRTSLWAELNDLSDSIDSEWIILGDFNCIASVAERPNGRTITVGDTIELQSFMEKYHITDLPYTGNFFTWTNKHQTGSRICSKLDRIFVNNYWMTSLQAHASFLTPGVSDHSPGIAELLPQKVVHPPFRFCNFWTNEDDFILTVFDSWLSNPPSSYLYGLQRKIKALKIKLKGRYGRRTKFLAQRINAARCRLHDIQNELFQDPSDSLLMMQEVQISEELHKLIKYELLFLQQRSKIK
ncbi:OLC1v1012590C1 [Oldenlandia corymbosa var. corymbosa]|uniref:OLC1v1012590C1 n=1 Tax=Oldenlandia corymbosa var. corymbosa TaxID=529605 RepID=A0AAV1DZH3_OLDCO|nr:OLC1v1012590C1 [Oldenlandia corymbosa var. corymbosa]